MFFAQPRRRREGRPSDEYSPTADVEMLFVGARHTGEGIAALCRDRVTKHPAISSRQTPSANARPTALSGAMSKTCNEGSEAKQPPGCRSRTFGSPRQAVGATPADSGWRDVFRRGEAQTRRHSRAMSRGCNEASGDKQPSGAENGRRAGCR